MTKKEMWLKLFNENEVALACAIFFCEKNCSNIDILKKNEAFIKEKIKELDEEIAHENMNKIFPGLKQQHSSGMAVNMTTQSEKYL